MRRLAFLLLAIFGSCAARAETASLEQSVKAVYLFKIPSFVTWPAQAFDSPDGPFTLCIVGPDPFGELIDRTVSGQHFDRHPIVVLRLAAAQAEAHCQMVYVASADSRLIHEALEAARNKPVLTVTDAADETDGQGMINFVKIDDHIRFTIDAGEAAKEGIGISSKLLSLAVSVRGRAR